jgi:hypothetical protein
VRHGELWVLRLRLGILPLLLQRRNHRIALVRCGAHNVVAREQGKALVAGEPAQPGEVHALARDQGDRKRLPDRGPVALGGAALRHPGRPRQRKAVGCPSAILSRTLSS